MADQQDRTSRRSLGLRVGEVVEVRAKAEILATLDARGCLDAMPFMPEMLQHCGKRFRVSKRAEKACDTIESGRGRRLFDTVHLENLRCDGSAHGGCQAHCLIWWREAWLKRVPAGEPVAGASDLPSEPQCREEDLFTQARSGGPTGAELYSCQVTRLRDFTSELRLWDPRQYIREIQCGNVGWAKACRVLVHAWRNMLRRRLGRRPVPFIEGRCSQSTPAERIPNLRPGDWVVVKSKAEIEATLDRKQRNRGLFFDIEALPYCGKRLQVRHKVERIIDEKTGEMRHLPNDCWVLEGAVCKSYQSRGRLFCTRSISSFWREIWLRRAPEPETSTTYPPG